MAVTHDLALVAVGAAEEGKATDVVLLDLEGKTLVADYFLVASGDSSRHIRAIAERIEEALAQAGLPLRHREGVDKARWILLDFGGIVCHIFSKADRDFYGLERFWGDAPRIQPGTEPAPSP